MTPDKKLYSRFFRLRITFFFFFFLSRSLFAGNKGPSSPYYFYAPHIASLFPFGKSEMDVIKKHKIKIIFQESSSETSTIYHFAPNGNLTYNVSTCIYKKKKIVLDSTVYIFDESNRIILRKKFGELYKRLAQTDSVSYDQQGRIHSYTCCTYIYDKKKNAEKFVETNLVFKKTEGSDVILQDISDSLGDKLVYYNSDNLPIKIIDGNARIDSVATQYRSEGYWTTTYFYRQTPDSIFKVGQQYIYKNKRLAGFIQYDCIWDGTKVVQDISYIYDDSGNLVLSIDKNIYRSKYIYVYNELGLVEQRSVTIGDRLNIDRFYCTEKY
jgi:hypothetical protein